MDSTLKSRELKNQLALILTEESQELCPAELLILAVAVLLRFIAEVSQVVQLEQVDHSNMD